MDNSTNRFRLLVFSVLALSFSACKKDKVKPALPNDVMTSHGSGNPYLSLNEGNYWVYERYHVDPDGGVVATGIIDTTFVGKDTVINNKTYHTFITDVAGGLIYTRYLRDSSSFIVNNYGAIIFSSEVFYETLSGSESPEWTTSSKMVDINVLTVVPKGTFTTMNFQTCFVAKGGFTFGVGDTLYRNHRFAKNIGIVEETVPGLIMDTVYIVRKLIDYHLK